MTFPLSPAPPWYSRFDWATAPRPRNGVFYVGGDDAPNVLPVARGATAYEARDYFGNVVSSGGIFIPDLPYSMSFDNGVNGERILTTDAFGNQTTPQQIMSNDTIYDDRAYSGGVAMKCQQDGGIRWTMERKTEHFGRFYYLRDVDNSNGTFLMTVADADNNAAAHILIMSNGRLRITDADGNQLTMSAVATLGQYVRLEFRVVHSPTAGLIELKLFNDPASLTPTETLTSPASWNTRAEASAIAIGQVNGTRDTDCWIDEIVANNPTYPGVDNVDALSGDILLITPEAPDKGWPCGWYRLYLTGSETDALFGDSYGATNFCVIRDDPRFVTMPDATVNGSAGQGESPDFVAKGVLGLGTSRILIQNAADPTSGTDTLETAIIAASLTADYWSNTGTPDIERPPRQPWAAFPNGGYTPEQAAGVASIVSILYPLGVTRFEGPSNEPALNATTATHMQAFQAAVHAGNPNAKAIGPSSVNINDLAGWRAFLDAGGGDSCDEIAFHAYNFCTNGDINLGRYRLEAFLALLAEYGLEDKPLWQTESVHCFNSVYGVYHPRRARVPMIQTLLMEQYGIPRERNNWWYDISHGFWNYPAWIINGDGSLNPQAVLGRVLAEETWGKPYDSAIDFGEPGNKMFLGSVYRNAAGAAVVAVMATSYMDGASITFTVTGASGSLTVVDGFGNESLEPIAHQTITVRLSDVPSYVRLPAGASVAVASCNDWPSEGLGTNLALDAIAATLDGAATPELNDGGFLTVYPSAGFAYTGEGAAPAAATLIFPSTRTVGRVVWFGMAAWQLGSTLLDVDVETTDDGGETWTTRKTVTKTASSFPFGTDSTNAGCSRETFWDEQWIYDIPLDAPVECAGVRLWIRDTSYGGEPDAAALAAGGQGWGAGNIAAQELAVYAAPHPNVVTSPFGRPAARGHHGHGSPSAHSMEGNPGGRSNRGRPAAGVFDPASPEVTS